jgi:hypothetical protein
VNWSAGGFRPDHVWLTARTEVLYADKGGFEAAVNTGDRPYFEIIVDLKD